VGRTPAAACQGSSRGGVQRQGLLSAALGAGSLGHSGMVCVCMNSAGSGALTANSRLRGVVPLSVTEASALLVTHHG
jgi:hypothetical protein